MTIALCAALCSQQPLTAPHRIAHLHNPLTALHRLASTSTTQHFNFSFTLGSIFFSSHACVDLASCALFAFDNSKWAFKYGFVILFQNTKISKLCPLCSDLIILCSL
ncbi:hypothetical protein glysoja_007528 [Glycine soja]|nr:hypothetical protein glysoja_007528 [Glycine soja]